jgi:hypothetical protein
MEGSLLFQDSSLDLSDMEEDEDEDLLDHIAKKRISQEVKN